MNGITRSIAPLAGLLLLSACAGGTAETASSPSTPTPRAEAPREITSALAVETVDSAWSIVHRTFWDTTFTGVDWRAVRDSVLPLAERARTNEEVRAIIRGMVGQLRQSHFAVIPADAEEDDVRARAEGTPGDAGMDVRRVDGRMLVTRVAPGGAAARAGVRAGWEVRGVGKLSEARLRDAATRLQEGMDERRAAFYLWAAVSNALEGTAGETVELSLRDGEGRALDRTLTLQPVRGQVAQYGNLSGMRALVEQDTVVQDGRRIGVIRFNVWMPVAVQAMDRAVDELRGMDGIVVDLRGNVGGVAGMAPGWAGHFLTSRDTLATMITRRDTMHFVANPRLVNAAGVRVRPFAGPVAVLTDEISASTSEFFAGGMQALGRARVFGGTSAGQALPAVAPKLPNGDVFMHALADMVGPGGVRWEARGVIPDVPAPLTREALLAGRDPALDAAVQWIVREDGRRAGSR